MVTDIRPELLPPPSRSGKVVVRTQKLDALSDPLPPHDICFANLLIHHLGWTEAHALLSRMREARLGAALFDLDRNFWAFHFLRLFFPLWVRSPVTVADALASVQQAFRPAELLTLAREAGIAKPRLRRVLFLRTLLWWETSWNR
jgi:hypothetical protein